MNSKIVLFYAFVTGAYIIGVEVNTVILSTLAPDQWENEDIILTCSYQGQVAGTNLFNWILTSSSGHTNYSYIDGRNNRCIALQPLLLNNPEYSYSCINATMQTLTLKRITQNRHGETWICQHIMSSALNSSNVRIWVKVPVKSVDIRSSYNTDTITENSTISWQCSTSVCRPEPTFVWYKQNSTQTNGVAETISVTNSTTIISDVLQSYNNTYYIRLNRNWNGVYIFCGVFNRDGNISISRKILLNITHPPDGPPRISELQNGSIITVILEKQVDLVCFVSGGNPLPRLEWNKNSDTPQKTSGNTVTRNISWKANDFNEVELTCTSIHPDKNDSTYLNVNVLYSTRIIDISLRYDYGPTVHYQSNISAIEGANVALVCNASGNPEPSYTWSCRNSTKATLEIGIIRREQSLNCTCFVENTMVPTYGENTTSKTNSTLFLNILYPPDIEQMNNVTVLEGSQVTRNCSVRAGNSDILSINWTSNGNSLSTSSILKFANISRNDESVYSCIVQYQMAATGLQPIFQNTSENVGIRVVYPPENVKISLQTKNGTFVDQINIISIIEGNQVNLRCAADSRPPVSTFQWTGLMNSSGFDLNIPSITRYQAVNLTCTAFNILTTTEPIQTVIANNIVTLQTNVLYPPRVNQMKGITVVEGEHLNYSCDITPGNPIRTMFMWLRDNESLQNDQLLTIKSVLRNQAGTFICNVQNTMISSDGQFARGEHSGQFNLNVQYKAQLRRFFVQGHDFNSNVTVNENETVYLVCETDGNPLANGEIYLDLEEKEYVHNKQNPLTFPTTSTNSSHILVMKTMILAQCTDSGIHVCKGRNTLHTGEVTETTGNLSLHVNCIPRKSPFHQFPNLDIFTSPISSPFTINFTTLAYPVPTESGYFWSRKTLATMQNWTPIDTSDKSMKITISGLQSNLTIYNVTQSDLGMYRVVVTNSIGSFSYTLNLTAAGKPDTPAQFENVEDLTTEQSVTLQWMPSFNGGLDQYFVLTYSQVGHNITKEEVIQDTGSNVIKHTFEGLASGTSYIFQLYAKNNVGISSPKEITVKTKHLLKQHSSGSPVGAAVGGALTSVAIVVVIIILVVLFRKRSQQKKPSNTVKSSVFKDGNVYQNISKEHDGKMELVSDAKFLMVENTACVTESPELPPRSSNKKETAFVLQELDDFDKNKEYAVYGNADEMRKRIERIDISELVSYLSDKTVEFFATEFSKLPQGLTHSYDFSQKPENIALNRYHGIYPYDHSRVTIPGEPDFFINACYIDGYKKKREYIASLGPLSRTTKRFVTFWQMVWNEKSDVIVMLTKLTEPSGVKCDQYWPKEGTSLTYGEVMLTADGEQVFSEYVLRKFTISKGKENRALTQFHFMAWPDKSVPEDVTCLLEFRRRVRACHSKGPMIVHCSAGIGRTGTLIAVDTLIEEGKSKGSVNVPECVKKMREQRVKMVQTPDQYYYIYKALVNALVLDTDSIKSEKFHKYADVSKIDLFSSMFLKFNQSVETDSTEESNARTFNKLFKEKNRIGSDLPGDRNRVRLFLNRDMESPDYINAVYLNSLTKQNHFIVAQSPLVNDVEDFLSLIYQDECICVVSMDGVNKEKTVGLYLPPDNSDMKIGSFNVSCSRLETKESYVVRKMKIEFTGQVQGGERTVYHFQYTGWSDGHKVPSDVQTVVDLTIDVENFIEQFGTEESHVLVHCLNAYERSCLFCAAVVLTEKIQYEGEVCVANTLRQIRTRRKLAFPNMEQFQFCFKAVDAYININKSGNVNDENAYMNMALKCE